MKPAHFSPCRLYRYALWRTIDASNPSFALFIGLNPSTADETTDDPTIRRCISFARDWGHGSVCVANLFAFRATLPSALKATANPIGPRNNFWLRKLVKKADMVVAAWGVHGVHKGRDAQILKLLDRELHCLGRTKAGHPRHPLYLKRGAKPIPFR